MALEHNRSAGSLHVRVCKACLLLLSVMQVAGWQRGRALRQLLIWFCHRVTSWSLWSHLYRMGGRGGLDPVVHSLMERSLSLEGLRGAGSPGSAVPPGASCAETLRPHGGPGRTVGKPWELDDPHIPLGTVTVSVP